MNNCARKSNIHKIVNHMISNNIAMTVYDMWDFLHPDKTNKPPQYKAHMLQRLVKSAIANNNIKVIQVKTREFTRGCGRIIYVAQH